MRWTGVLAVVVLAAACSGDDGDVDDAAGTTVDGSTTTSTTAAPDPLGVEIEGPITGGARGIPYNPMPAGLAEEFGYVEEELFVSGEATAYRPAAPLTADGAWQVEPAGAAPYTTRLLVRRPENPADANGVVVVEWLNVSAGRDSDPDFGFLHEHLMDEGYTYVGVSAQATGVEGGGARLEVPGVPPEALLPLKEWDPERYDALDHPGDAFSYDIFRQAGEVARARFDATTVLAVGESQSAARMVSYVDAVHLLDPVYDGFLVHSRGGTPAPLDDTDAGAAPAGTIVREDVDVPVLVFQTETDLDFLRSVQSRQPDSANVVTWEVAGTAHADATTLDYGQASALEWASAEAAGVNLAAMCGTVNDGPQAQVLRAALEQLREWVVDGEPPPAAPPIETDAAGEIVRDELGIAAGGIRTPAVDAPVTVPTGVGNPVSVFCSLFGQETPLPPDVLAERYGTTDGYVDAVERSAQAAVDAGFLLADDAAAMVDAAREVAIP